MKFTSDYLFTLNYVKLKQNLTYPFPKPLCKNMILETLIGIRIKPIKNKQVMYTQPL